MTSTTRGALSPAVYWRRRLFVGGVVLALVLMAVNLVSGGDDRDAGVRATTAGADQGASSVADGTGVLGPTAGKSGKKGKKGRQGRNGARSEPTIVRPTAPALAEPQGACANDEIAVTPTVERAVAGRTALVVLKLRTLSTAACTWQVSADSLAVRVSVGDDEVWSSRECPGVLPVLPVVVRAAVFSTYEFRWNTRRSDDGCPQLTAYAPPGDYRVTAASYGGEAEYVIFDLATPTAPEPEPAPQQKKSSEKQQKKSAQKQAQKQAQKKTKKKTQRSTREEATQRTTG
ncbi:MAG: hypothetical protein WB471_11210 [Nocardioides sp.]